MLSKSNEIIWKYSLKFIEFIVLHYRTEYNTMQCNKCGYL